MNKPPSLRERYGYLPAVLVLVLEVAGEDAMLRLVTAAGGTRLLVRRVPPVLVQAVGAEAARMIQARLAAEHITKIDVPMMSRTLEKRRRERILTLRAEGSKVADIARAMGITERGVYLALARARQTHDDRQLPLF